jgi:hypothetical protein
MVAGLQARGFQVLPSAANFVFAQRPGGEGAALAAGLREHKVLVRHFRAPERIAPFLRISVGTEADRCAARGAGRHPGLTPTPLSEHPAMRTAQVSRNTQETKISVSLNLDGTGQSSWPPASASSTTCSTRSPAMA